MKKIGLFIIVLLAFAATSFAQGNSGNANNNEVTNISFASVKITGSDPYAQTLEVRVSGPDADELDYLTVTPTDNNRIGTVPMTKASSGTGNGNTAVYVMTANWDGMKDANGDVNLYLAAAKIPRPLSAIQVKIKGR